MKTLNSTPIEPVLDTIRSEVATAHQLLVDFEHAINQGGPMTKDLNSKLQGFDLAMQILTDVEHLAQVLGQQFSSESALPNPLPLSGVRLERIRVKLSRGQKQLSETGRQESARAVDLF